MDSYNWCNAQADSIKLKDITSCEYNQEFLCRLKDNDPDSTKVVMNDGEAACDEYNYIPNGARDLGWLGYFISNNTHLQEIGPSQS